MLQRDLGKNTIGENTTVQQNILKIRYPLFSCDNNNNEFSPLSQFFPFAAKDDEGSENGSVREENVSIYSS